MNIAEIEEQRAKRNAEIVRRYPMGETAQELSNEFGISTTAVYSVLRKFNVDVRSVRTMRRRPQSHEVKANAEPSDAFYEAGFTLTRSQHDLVSAYRRLRNCVGDKH